VKAAAKKEAVKKVAKTSTITAKKPTTVKKFENKQA
jgi:hypothetical protein